MIPWAKPHFWGNEKKYVNDALDSEWISGGSYLEKLESRFSEILGKKHILTTSNGTTSLHLAYLGLDLKRGDEVIVPGFAFLAASNLCLHMGLKPVFAEVCPKTWCLTAEAVEKVISKKTKVIVPIHTYGNVCEMNDIMNLADKHDLFVIEDCAESLFSKYKGKYCGTFGNINSFSFQATKTITTGEGGLVATDNEIFFKKMLLYRSHGLPVRGQYFHELPGHNFRLTNLQAALGYAQIESMNLIVAERNRVFSKYVEILNNEEGIILQKINKDVNPVIWALAIFINPKVFKQGRDKLIEQLKREGIETRPGFVSSSKLNIYTPHSLPICENLGDNVLSLPSFPTLKNEDIEFICSKLLALRSF